MEVIETVAKVGIMILVFAFLFSVVFLLYSYYRDIIIQEEEDGKLHTIAYVDMEVVYETYMQYDDSQSTVLQYAIKTSEYDNAKQKQEEYIEGKQNEPSN